MRSFQLACVGSQTSMPMPCEYERAVLSFSAVTPGPTNSLTRHRSAAAIIGGLGTSCAASSSPFFTSRTAITEVSASGWKAVLIPSSQASGSACAGTMPPPAASSSSPTKSDPYRSPKWSAAARFVAIGGRRGTIIERSSDNILSELTCQDRRPSLRRGRLLTSSYLSGLVSAAAPAPPETESSRAAR